MNLELLRLDANQFGVLRAAGELICVTLELPYLDNKKNVSSIPVGTYEGRRVYDRKNIPETFELTVAGRSGILFHTGNTHADTQGCILCGMTFSISRHEPFLINSKDGFRKFLKALEFYDRISLTVRSV